MDSTENLSALRELNPIIFTSDRSVTELLVGFSRPYYKSRQ